MVGKFADIVAASRLAEPGSGVRAHASANEG
jgi:hypothetical protein